MKVEEEEGREREKGGGGVGKVRSQGDSGVHLPAIDTTDTDTNVNAVEMVVVQCGFSKFKVELYDESG